MINYALIAELDLAQAGYLAEQLRKKGFEDLGEGTGWEKGDPRWERVKGAQELYSGNGYRLFADPDARLMFYTHSD